MRLGLIARADSRGLGIQTKSFHDAMHPAKTMVVDCPSAKPLPLRRDWYPDATWIHGLPSVGDFRTWLQDLDVVYTAETGYSQALWDEAERVGVKTVLHANWEFLDRRDRPSLWLAPSMWHFDEFPERKRFLPVPIETLHVGGTCKESARNFLHVVGRPAIHDRNGTEDLIAALRYVQSPIMLTIRCQEPGYVETRIRCRDLPSHVRLNIQSGDVPDNADLYRGQDVLVMPRRFGGLCLPCNEALGAGMPVIMPDISPNEWLPEDWLVPARAGSSFKAKQYVDVHETDCKALAAKIDQLASDDGFYSKAAVKAREIAQGLSWDTLKPLYEKTLSELCSVPA